ncbi:hypothetical protein [Fodinicola feengrottensis]|uniref:hypothetical protein n=1 Tax=Fodinicola feengrottensis TaxID=435914 RepID=UPI0024434DAC|nr:hypothetical protein [Fodinicola feengrottensis]
MTTTSAVRLIVIILTLYVACKIAVLWRGPRPTGGSLCVYLLWPGMDTRPFLRRSPHRGWPWLGRGLIGLGLGVAGTVALRWAAPHLGRYAVGWLGVARSSSPPSIWGSPTC